MGDPEVKFKKAVHTIILWLSHEQAISAIQPSIILTFEKEVVEIDDAVACGIVHSMKSHYFVSTVQLLSDIFPHLSTLSLVFQTENIDFSIVQPQVAATIAALKHYKSNPGPHLRDLDCVLLNLPPSLVLLHLTP